MSSAQVYVKEITKKFGEITAIDSLDLIVPQGEFLTILGPSGCGKTTLLRIIGGFEEPTSGQVFIGDEDFTFAPPHRRPTNMVFQRYALFPHMNVFENIAFGLRVKKLDENEIQRRVRRMLSLVRLEGYDNRQINQLSGGQAQRVALARAIVNEPEVLLLDEPLGALDLKIRQQMEIELKLLHAELGMTFIYVTHDQEEAMTVSNRIVVMCAGTIIQDGSPEEIYSNPVNTFVADFIGHSNLIPASVVQVEPTILEFFNGTHTVRTDLGLHVGQKVNVLLRPEVLNVSLNPPENDENFLSGRIVDATFKGPFMDYLIEVETRRLMVRQSFCEESSLYERGTSVSIAWMARNALVLTE